MLLHLSSFHGIAALCWNPSNKDKVCYYFYYCCCCYYFSLNKDTIIVCYCWFNVHGLIQYYSYIRWHPRAMVTLCIILKKFKYLFICSVLISFLESQFPYMMCSLSIIQSACIYTIMNNPIPPPSPPSGSPTPKAKTKSGFCMVCDRNYYHEKALNGHMR